MLIYVKLLLQDLFRPSEVLHFLVANMTGASHALSPVFCCLAHARIFFLALLMEATTCLLICLPCQLLNGPLLCCSPWGPGTKVLIPEQVLQDHILGPATPARIGAYCCARLLKVTFLIIKSLNSKSKTQSLANVVGFFFFF